MLGSEPQQQNQQQTQDEELSHGNRLRPTVAHCQLIRPGWQYCPNGWGEVAEPTVLLDDAFAVAVG